VNARGPVLAVDVGGTKIAAAIVDADGSIRARATTATPAGAGGEKVTAALDRLVREVAAQGPPARLVGIGVGSAGPLDIAAGTVSPVNIPDWRPYPIVDALRPILPGRPAVLAGDGHCMALGEYWRGGYTTAAMLGMVVSTGVGGGLVLDGRIHTGLTGNAGHIGHIVVDLDGPQCPCGGRGCVEALASGPSMTKWAWSQGWRGGLRGAERRALTEPARRAEPERSGGQPGESQGWRGGLRGAERRALTEPARGAEPERSGGQPGESQGWAPAGPPDARTLARDARDGDPVARAAFQRSATALAAGIICAGGLLDLDDVVVGGGVAGAGDLLFTPLREAVADLAGLAFIRRVRIHPSPLGTDAGLLGAAALILGST
jgi:glucokinase